MSLVFVSYSHRDRSVVRNVVSIIREGGFDVWFDIEQLNSNDDFGKQISDAIRSARFIIVCLSEPMMSNSGYVFLEHRVFRQRFAESRASILPLRLDGCTIPEDLMGCHEAISWLDGVGGRELLAALNTLCRSEQNWISRLISIRGRSRKSRTSTLRRLGVGIKEKEGPITIVFNKVFTDILGSVTSEWKKTYRVTPSIDEVLTDLRISYPFALVSDEAERTACIASTLSDSLLSLIGSPSPTPFFFRYLRYLDIGDANLKKLLLKVAELGLHTLRANNVRDLCLEIPRGTISHYLFFFVRPGSFASISRTLAADHLADVDALVRGLSAKIRDRNRVLGNVCVVDVFLALLAHGQPSAEAALTFLKSPHDAVCAKQPPELNRIVLCPELVSENAADLMGVDAAELKQKTTFRDG